MTGPPTATPSIVNWTEPVGTSPFGTPVTVAVTVTVSPKAEGFRSVSTCVLVAAASTVWSSGVALLAV